MNWVVIAAIGYSLTAFNVIIDKILLRKPIKHPAVFAFYTGILSIFVMVLTPLGIYWPGTAQFAVSLLTGIVFIAAMIVFYGAIVENEVSKVVPVVGGLTPVFAFLLSNIFLGESLAVKQMTAFLFLVSGSVFILLNKKTADKNFNLKIFQKPVLAASLFSIFYVLTKFIYLNQQFISGFVWTRLGSFLAAVFLFVLPKTRKLIFENIGGLKVKMGGVFVANKALGAIAFILINYAISLGNVALVNAMESFQYVFLFIFSALLSITYPEIFKEEISVVIIFQKIFAIILIAAGFFMLI